jgi:hypothetical protein
MTTKLQRDNDAPRKVHDTAGGLPEYCFAAMPSDPTKVIRIQRGVIGYFPTNCPASVVNEMNAGRTPAQLQAMEAGSMWGWDVPAADPANYHPDGRAMTKAELAARDATEAEPAADPRTTTTATNPHGTERAALRRALTMAVDFIENVTFDDPTRTDRFFECREAWREAFALENVPEHGKR